MIATMQGKVASISDQELILLVTGIGFTLQVPCASLFEKNTEIFLHTYMHWNQDQGPSLFGFSTELEKTVFLLIISCSGIGPKIALSALSQLTPGVFIQAVQQGDEKLLSSISGIGSKKAEQIIVHLKHKVAKLVETGVVTEDSGVHNSGQWTQVIQVLQSLNYSRTEIDTALSFVRKEHKESTVAFDVLMRSSLAFLAKRSHNSSL